MTLELAGKTVLILGLGQSGLSCVHWLHARGARVRVADTRALPPGLAVVEKEFPEISVERGPFREESFAGVELIVVSPGVPLSEPLIVKYRAQGVPVAGDIELFAQWINATALQPRSIGVTGSNGKSTVTSMVGAMCRAAGLRTVVAGNIGLPVLDAWTSAEQGLEPELLALELSSFQLESTSSLHLDAATVLNVTQDHMDRYDRIEDYAAAKARIFLNCDKRVLNRDDAYSRARGRAQDSFFGLDEPPGEGHWGVRSMSGISWLAEGDQNLMPVADLKVAGLHNAANALAALALCRALDLPYPPLLAALREFRGLPHRVEKVAEIEGVTYYDDSKGTNVGATVAALNGMACPVVLIAGGDGKGQDFTPLRAAVDARARAIVLIGRDAPAISAALSGCAALQVLAADMGEAVHASFELARPGDAVLLSPACASFDMFQSYAHRAQVYLEAVRNLADEQRLKRLH